MTYDLIVGLGQTGSSIARYLTRQQRSFIVFDTRPQPSGLAAFQATYPEVPVYLEYLPLDQVLHIERVIVSPGVALDHPVMQQLAARGLPILGDIECFAREVTAPIIAITGTNGKSTVTTLVTEMLKASGRHVAMGGNIGVPALDLLSEGQRYDVFVLELSSFQLNLVQTFAPKVATILNITADHLDRHHSFEAYVAAKQRIYLHAEKCVYPLEDPNAYPKIGMSAHRSFGLVPPTTSEAFGIAMHQSKLHFMKGTLPLLPVDALRIKGRHNWANALAALGLVDALGVLSSAVIDALAQFSGLSHRTQWIRTIDGIEFVNDSKGTNVGATLSALSGLGPAIQGKIVLIAGGQGKGASFLPLREPLAQYARAVVLVGEDAPLIEQAIQGVVPHCCAVSFEEAVMLAKQQAMSGDMVLLSPACASLDLFRDFNHRGEVFTALVEAL